MGDLNPFRLPVYIGPLAGRGFFPSRGGRPAPRLFRSIYSSSVSKHHQFSAPPDPARKGRVIRQGPITTGEPDTTPGIHRHASRSSKDKAESSDKDRTRRKIHRRDHATANRHTEQGRRAKIPSRSVRDRKPPPAPEDRHRNQAPPEPAESQATKRKNRFCFNFVAILAARLLLGSGTLFSAKVPAGARLFLGSGTLFKASLFARLLHG